ncbi:MAG: peptide chain release factor N(5)-glutamine methyltransferase [Verrucomicrobiota bacterium]
MTVLEVIKKSTEFLTRKGVESPRLQVELLLAHVLQLPRLKLYLSFERTLNDGELDALRTLVKRRGEREPLQHILGSMSFCGLEMKVGPEALVPRQETELLAERGWQFLKSISTATPLAFDFGTGTGCLAIALAVNCPNAHVHAVDISPEALELARENAARHAVQNRLTFHQGDGFAPLPPGVQFDLIVANPPYIPSAEIATLQPEVCRHDPRLALDGGADGLDFYRRLAVEAKPFLAAHGRLMLEFGDGQAAALREIFTKQGWQGLEVEKDYTRRERFFIATMARA